MKRCLLILVIFLMIFNHSSKLYGHTRVVRTVVIDPGHGGRDPGAVGRNNLEKDINLSISLKLGELINRYIPDVNVIYTRKTDVFVGLNERATIANRNNADLFISIHCNGAGNRSAHGSETFVMGYDKSASNLAVAMRENASIFFEEDYQYIYDGFDPSKPETHIIFSLFQHQYINQSLKMAALIQDQFRERSHRVDRGVKQGPFWVLHKTAMPAVLVEVGFLTNEEEEKFLASNEGQNIIASAIFRAFRDYKNSIDRLEATTIPNEPVVFQHTPAPSVAINPKPQVVSEPIVQKEEELPVIVTERVINWQNNDNARIAEPESIAPPANPIIDEVKSSLPNVVFKVQFLSSDRLLPQNSPLFKGLRNVDNYHYMGLHRYTVGHESSLDSALRLRTTVRNQGFKDAFVVAFINGKRTTIQEAQRLLAQ